MSETTKVYLMLLINVVYVISYLGYILSAKKLSFCNQTFVNIPIIRATETTTCLRVSDSFCNFQKTAKELHGC